MINLDEIKKRAESLKHASEDEYTLILMSDVGWAADTILSLVQSLAAKDAEIERLQKEIKQILTIGVEMQREVNRQLANRNDDLKSELAEKDSVLEFYSIEDNVFMDWDEISGASYLQERHKTRAYDDFGTTAREVMAKYKGE